MVSFPKVIQENWKVMLVYSAVATVILWPLLSPGFILTLDMVFTPKLAMPETLTPSYLFRAGLHLLSLVIPSDVIEKFILFAILVLSGLGMHRLMRSLSVSDSPMPTTQWAAYASGLLYTINPFTYSRFMAGQYSVLLGYAGIPFFVVALLRFLDKPSLKKAIILTGVSLVISIVSIHTLGLILIISLIAIAQATWRSRADPRQLKRLAKYGAVASLTFVIASGYWLLPVLQGSSTTAISIATFRGSDQSVFATGGDGVDGKLMHAVRLQGFWGERHNLFLLPQDELAPWGLAVTIVWLLVIGGGVIVWRQQRATGVLFMSSIAIAALLAAGVGSPWLVDHVPFFAGYREPQKFVGLIALGYAVFVGFAITGLTTKIRSRIGRLGLGIILTLVLIGFTPVMFRGFDYQLVPRPYPADWYAMNDRLNEDKETFQVLFLPWHLYMRFEFAGRLIANPGEGFFDKPLLVSDNPEIGSVGPAVANTQKQLLTAILAQTAESKTLGARLAPLQIKYVLLAKDDDYQTYGYLDNQTDLQLVSETETLKLYRVTVFRKGSE